jgi:hypothetical protein
MSRKPEQFGPTHDYPHGSLGPSDHGGLRMGIARDSKGNVILNFGTYVDWIAMPPGQAVTFALNLLKHAGVTKVVIENGNGTIEMGEDDG